MSDLLPEFTEIFTEKRVINNPIVR